MPRPLRKLDVLKDMRTVIVLLYCHQAVSILTQFYISIDESIRFWYMGLRIPLEVGHLKR